jgi:hypothetical protein
VAGSFTSGRFRFEVALGNSESDTAQRFREYLEDDGFDVRLTRTGKVPELGGAPVASWLLARLAHLTDGRLGLASEEHTDGGGYVVEFVVYLAAIDPAQQRALLEQPLLFNLEELGVFVEPERLVASFQFQADMEGATVLGERAADCPAEEVLAALAAALLVAPAGLMPREVAVRDPELREDPEMYRPRPRKGSRNSYGWDGFEFLGKDNIR